MTYCNIDTDEICPACDDPLAGRWGGGDCCPDCAADPEPRPTITATVLERYL